MVNELKDALKKFGWDDKLINAYVDKQFDTISTNDFSQDTSQFVDMPNIIIDNEGEFSRQNILLTVK